MDQLDHAHTASGSGQRRGRRGVGQVRFGTVFFVVPGVVQSHPASVSAASRLTGPRDPRHRTCPLMVRPDSDVRTRRLTQVLPGPDALILLDDTVTQHGANLPDLQVAVAAAQAGAAVVLAKYGTRLVQHEKTPSDFATDADLEAERAIRGVISDARPDDAVVGEELGSDGAARQGRRWLVDPLCGTLNFAAQTPLFSVNVALLRGEGNSTAAVADPLSGETFWADGAATGVRRTGTNVLLAASGRSRLVDVNVDGPHDEEFLGPQLLADREFRSSFGPRVSSTTLALAWVAAGRRAAYITDGDLRESVHFTAGLALCQAAGCVVTDLLGNPLHSGPGVVAAADAAIHTTLLEIVARHLPSG